MLFRRTPEEKTGLEETIDYTQQRLLAMDPDSEEFAKTLDQLEQLYKIKSNEKKDVDRVSKDVLVTVAANLIGIVAILNYEQAHVIGSKALNFVLKTKV